MTPAYPVHAQDAGALRGTVTDDPLDQLLLLAAPYGGPDTAPASSAPPADLTDETPTGTVRAQTIDSQDELILDAGAERAQPIEGLDRKPKENLFEAPGVRVGSFILKPTVEQGITATSNADQTPSGSGALLSETALRLNAVSDWSSHSATIDAYGLYRKTISGEEIDEFAGGIAGALELELGKDYRGLATLGYARRPESATSPVVVVGAAEQPIREILTGSLGLEKDVGKARFAATGAAEQDRYGDAELESGGVLSQKDRNSTLYSMTLRAGYEISPALTPFIETEIGRRLYELRQDSAGYARSSDLYAARAGLALDLGEKLSGEFKAGWVREEFDDPRLIPISGPTIDGVISWSPVRGTIVDLIGSTTVEETTTAGESGSILYAGALALRREMRSNLTGNAVLGAGWRNYTGSDAHDLILSAEAGLTWWLNRYAGLTGRVRHETLKSNLPDRDSETNSVFLGLKLQR